MLEQLKDAVMELAEEKKWGTTPDQVNVPEKLLLIGSELYEAYEVHLEQKRIIDHDREVYLEHDAKQSRMSWNLLFYNGSRPYNDPPGDLTRPLLEKYRTEWADVLLRVLHVGGMYGVTFQDPTDLVSITFPSREHEDKRFANFSMLFSATANHYRRKRMAKFEAGLVEMAHFCLAVAETDRFDIMQLACKKIQENWGRDWKSQNLNEKLV